MSRPSYSIDLCRELNARVRALPLRMFPRRQRYEAGERLVLPLRTAWPDQRVEACFRITTFAGGGYAGQVYRCMLESVDDVTAASAAGLYIGGVYAVKILVPPGRFAAGFRNVIYGMAFQAPFSAQVIESACRAGLLWPKVLRLAAAAEWGRPDAIADTHASFFDPEMRAYGEVREWVEGRVWRLESDLRPALRRRWRTVNPAETQSPEYIAKRQFMDRLVRLLHRMGAPELARQYEWSTMKSQPNVLKRHGAGEGPGDGLCAVDFRAGLALIPILPMSPGDFKLILAGIRRGSLTQFDRFDADALREYASAHPDAFCGKDGLLEALISEDADYRRRMPDLWHQGRRLLTDARLRADVREGLVAGDVCRGRADDVMAARLRRGGLRFAAYYLIGAIPVLGNGICRLWGNRDYRSHVAACLTRLGYLRMTGRAAAAATAVAWHRAGRVGEAHARRVADHPALFWCERLSVGLLPAGLHRILCEPGWAVGRVSQAAGYVRRFLRDGAFREQWLLEQIQEGERDGMLHPEEAAAIRARIGDPFIAKYLKSVGVHLAFLPVTQVVSLTVGALLAAHTYAATHDAAAAGLTFAAVLVFFQVFPISPGSICRGCYVLYLMIRERNGRDYAVAAPLSFVKYIGYLAFPLQMTASYPELAQFMAGRWATAAVHMVPVFGEKGALLEHAVFDACFNRPRIAAARLGAHARGVLNAWMLAGVTLGIYHFGLRGVQWNDPVQVKGAVNLALAILCLCVLPRILVYPLLRRRSTPAKERTPED